LDQCSKDSDAKVLSEGGELPRHDWSNNYLTSLFNWSYIPPQDIEKKADDFCADYTSLRRKWS